MFTDYAPQFWSRVDKSGECWIWTGSRSGKHGQCRYGGAHRVAWQITNGPIPRGLYVCHDCPGGDNPLCVRPSHMFLGTHGDNMRDMVRKGMHRTGRTQITPAIVLDIRAQYDAKTATLDELADKYDIAYVTAQNIARRWSWKHI